MRSRAAREDRSRWWCAGAATYAGRVLDDELYVKGCDKSFGRVIILSTSVVSTARRPLTSHPVTRSSVTWQIRLGRCGGRTTVKLMSATSLVVFEKVCWRDVGRLEGTTSSSSSSRWLRQTFADPEVNSGDDGNSAWHSMIDHGILQKLRFTASIWTSSYPLRVTTYATVVLWQNIWYSELLYMVEKHDIYCGS